MNERRDGPPGAPAPGGRPASAARSGWDLWVLRALAPDAGPDDLAALIARRRETARLSRRILVGGEGDHRRLREEARAFLLAHPELHRGLVLSLHLGPYSLIPGLYLDCGLSPVVLLDREAHDRIRPEADRRRRELRLPGEPTWLTTDRPAFAGRLLRALRAGRPVLVYLDGNSGAGGMEATRERGMPYRLPGRSIRVRTGLGRLVLRCGAPVRTLTVRWREGGGLDWEAGTPRPWPAGADPEAVTRSLYDWLFAEVRRSPGQWSSWRMLATAGDCFAAAGLRVDPDAAREREASFLAALAERADEVRLVLRPGVEVWEPDVLADPRRDAFYPADGLTAASLELLRAGPATLARLTGLCGRRWMARHARRLAALDLVRLEEA